MIGEKPLVSIIVPVYNIEQYICECLESVRVQSYGNFECIIVDDCGNDNSILSAQKQIQAWGGDSRFRIVRRTENGGLSAARNTGIDNSRGDYIYFLDGDDKIMPKALECLVAVAIRHDKVQMVQGNVIYEDGDKIWQFSPNDFPEYSDDREWVRAQMLKWKISITAWNKMYRSDYVKANGLRFSEGIIIHEDVKWCWDNQKVLQSMAFCNYHCYWYRTGNPNSIMHNVDKTDSSVGYLKIVQSISGDIQDENELVFVKMNLPFQVTLLRWAFSKDRKRIRRAMKGILKGKKTVPRPLFIRCLVLYLVSYIFPFDRYKRKYSYIEGSALSRML